MSKSQEPTTAKDYLQRVRNDLTRRQQLEERRANLHSRAFPGAIRPKVIQVQESAPPDKTAQILARVDALDFRIATELAQIRRRRVQAEYWISLIDNVLYRQILEQYYCTPIAVREEISGTEVSWVCTQTWEMVAVVVHKSAGHVRNIHADAIKAFSLVSGLPVEEPEKI